MYPTPPSLEQNTVNSPCYGTTVCPDYTTSETDVSKEKDNEDRFHSLLSEAHVSICFLLCEIMYSVKLISYMNFILIIPIFHFFFQDMDVWVPPLIHIFPESPEYFIKELRFFQNVNSDLVYQPYRRSNLQPNGSCSFEDAVGFDKFVMGKYVNSCNWFKYCIFDFFSPICLFRVKK